MKIKTTQKQIKENYNYILSLGYCEGERLFKYFEPHFYIKNNNGWVCDVYTFRKGFKCFAVSTGYGYLKHNEKNVEYKREKISKTLKKVERLKQRFYKMEDNREKMGRFKNSDNKIELIQKIIIKAFWKIIEK